MKQASDVVTGCGSRREIDARGDKGLRQLVGYGGMLHCDGRSFRP
jgi:hypothetical protein